MKYQNVSRYCKTPARTVLPPTAGGSVIQGNIIGLSSSGLVLGNNSGIGIDGTTGGMTIGGTSAGARNVVSGNRFGGINIFTNSTAIPANVVIKGNYIGTTAAGNVIAGNGAAGPNGGVEITGANTRRVDVRSIRSSTTTGWALTTARSSESVLIHRAVEPEGRTVVRTSRSSTRSSTHLQGALCA